MDDLSFDSSDLGARLQRLAKRARTGGDFAQAKRFGRAFDVADIGDGWVSDIAGPERGTRDPDNSK